jgi:Ni/Co efflux regulator RcnB
VAEVTFQCEQQQGSFMKAVSAVAAVFLIVGTWAAPAAAQHQSYTYKPHPHTSNTAKRESDNARDRDDYSEGYRDSERRRYVYAPTKRRDPSRYSPYRYRATVRYAYPDKYIAGTWAIGSNLPPGYFAPGYYVDYRHYRLSPPPTGYQWVRIDKDVYLVSEGTGFIRDVLYELFY